MASLSAEKTEGRFPQPTERLERLTCRRCLHSWFPRRPGRPALCPRCKSPRWDEHPVGRLQDKLTDREGEELIAVFVQFMASAPKREREVVRHWLSLWARDRQARNLNITPRSDSEASD